MLAAGWFMANGAIVPLLQIEAVLLGCIRSRTVTNGAIWYTHSKNYAMSWGNLQSAFSYDVLKSSLF
jgi:hypothetical protein